MRAMLRVAVLLPALICLPLLALGQVVPGTDKGDKGAMDETKIRKKMLDSKYLQGVIVDADLEGTEKFMTLKVDWEVKRPNAEGQKKYAELYKQYQQAARGDKNRAKDLYNQLLAASAGTYDVEKTPLEFKIKVTADTRVRRAEPPPKDADNPKAKYTAGELSKLKGTGNLPGYTADIKDIQINETVLQITVDKPKAKTPAKTDPKDKTEKDKADKTEKDKSDKDKGDEEVYTALLIMIPPPPKELPGNPFLSK